MLIFVVRRLLQAIPVVFLASVGVFASHQMQLTASFTRTLRTLTHSAGVGSFAGFHQKNSWARWNPNFRQSMISSS